MFDSQWGHHVRYTIWHETYPLDYLLPGLYSGGARLMFSHTLIMQTSLARLVF